MWHTEPDIAFTPMADQSTAIDIPPTSAMAEWFKDLEGENAGNPKLRDHFEVLPRPELKLLTVCLRQGDHWSKGEVAFWDAIWSLLRVWERGGVAPLRKEMVEALFVHIDPAEKFDCNAAEKLFG